MRSRGLSYKANGLALFNRIHTAAKTGDVDKLKAMVAAGIQFKLYCGAETPVMRLAIEADWSAVARILDVACDADLGELFLDKVEGAARGGHQLVVNEVLDSVIRREQRPGIIYGVRAKALCGYAARGLVNLERPPLDLGEMDERQRYEFRQYIIEGYAKGNQHELVRAELERTDVGADPMSEIVQSAIKGYALNGNWEKVSEILDALKQTPNLEKEFFESFAERALYYFAVGGWVDLVNDMLVKYHFPVEVVRGYAFGGHLDEMDMLLELLANTKEESLRAILAGQACKLNPELNLLEVTRKTTELLHLMSKYRLSYAEVRRFLAQGERGISWMLQGPQLVAAGRIPQELFEKISADVLGVDDESVRRIHDALNARLLTDTLESIKPLPRNRFFSFFRQKIEDKRPEIERLSVLRGGYYIPAVNDEGDHDQCGVHRTL